MNFVEALHSVSEGETITISVEADRDFTATFTVGVEADVSSKHQLDAIFCIPHLPTHMIHSLCAITTVEVDEHTYYQCIILTSYSS